VNYQTRISQQHVGRSLDIPAIATKLDLDRFRPVLGRKIVGGEHDGMVFVSFIGDIYRSGTFTGRIVLAEAKPGVDYELVSHHEIFQEQ